ncbi:hypothetical protein AVEN_66444-1 [Araneus ventricosus]|uniref:Uncharacterized protein n=1 Tax=Araneus ventricosus TaxID=182803 RepID=A0A4Y2NSX1_ARAVE|nr:hypothetical protein AVEN_66444-1 [Araneus ventricosus]
MQTDSSDPQNACSLSRNISDPQNACFHQDIPDPQNMCFLIQQFRPSNACFLIIYSRCRYLRTYQRLHLCFDDATGILRLVCRCEAPHHGDDCEKYASSLNNGLGNPPTTDANECVGEFSTIRHFLKT